MKTTQSFLPDSKAPGMWTKQATDKSFIIFHNTGSSASAKNESDNLNRVENKQTNSFHVVIDENEVIEKVPFLYRAHHAGAQNPFSIGIEVARSNHSDLSLYDRAELNAYDYCAIIFKQYGWKASEVNQRIRFHREFMNTSCAIRVPQSRYAEVRNEIAKRVLALEGGTVPEEPVNPPVEISKERYINIHPQDKYGVYGLGVVPVAKNISWYLSPNEFNGLSYKIEDGDTHYQSVYFITTRDKGKQMIYVDSSRASITDVPLYGKVPVQKPPVVDKKEYINLKPLESYPTYGYYREGDVPVVKNIAGYLQPLAVEGITYEIQKWVNPKVVLVKTRDFGTVQLFVDPTRSTLSSEPTYKVYG